MFLARDGGTILHAVTLGIVPIHLWLMVYLGLCAVAWVQGPQRRGMESVALLWLAIGASILILSWWLPQWIVWLVPMATVFAGQSSRFLWLWAAVNSVALVNNLIEWPHNLDGHMLSLVLGHGVHFTYRALVAAHGLELVFTVLIVGFAALVYEGRRTVDGGAPRLGWCIPWWWYGLPFLAYTAAMTLQQLQLH